MSTEFADQQNIDLFALMKGIWQRRVLIAASFAGFVVLAIIYLHGATYVYTAQLLVTPTQTSLSRNLGGGLGALSGLASLSGIDMNLGGGAPDFQLYIESLHSHDVASRLLNDKDLMKVVFRGEIDPSTGKWVQPPNRFVAIKNIIKRVLGIPIYPWQPPDATSLQEYLKAAIRIRQDPKTPVVIVETRHVDPQFAIRFLQAVNKTADARLRENALSRADQYIAYLTDQLSKVSVTEHRLALANALSEQEKTRMMSNSTTPFAAEPFGQPFVSRRPTQPTPVLLLLSSGVAGIFVGTLIALLLSIHELAKRRPAVS